MNLLRLADSDIPGTGKVYHEMFKTEKLLEKMSVEYDFIHQAASDAISSKWLQHWTDLHNPLHVAGYCLDPEFHSHDHSACAEALKDLFFMCNKVHGAGSAASAKVYNAGILQNETVWANAAKMPPEAWYEMYVKPWKLVCSRTHSYKDLQQARV